MAIMAVPEPVLRTERTDRLVAPFRVMLVPCCYLYSVKLDIDICEMFNMGSITAQLSDLTVCNIPQFTEMISKADNFEIYPRTDGTIQLNITFQSMLKAI